MTPRSRIWVGVGAAFTALNFGGAVYALLMAEPIHAGVHIALGLLGAYFVVWASRSREMRLASTDLNDRLTNLEHSLDAVAIEIERIGESQRFLTKLYSENAPARREAQGAPAPGDLRAR